MTDVPRLSPRLPETHKGSFGHALVVGGSRGMTGAVVLAGTAASRAGAGLVTLGVPDRCLETVAGFDANYMTVGLADDGHGRLAGAADSKLIQLAEKATSIGIGPGLSRSDGVTQVVSTLYQQYTGPMIADADALNALASRSDGGMPAANGPRILTPHIGEFRRLLGDPLSPDECRKRAPEFAAKHHLILVLKGHHTLVTDGVHVHENTTGNPGMATGGSGDVLTGVLTALVHQGLSLFDAVRLGVHVHGLAGDLARDQFGEVSMVAENIRDHISGAFRLLAKRQ